MKVRKLSLGLGLAAVSVAGLGAVPAFGADHRDAPLSTANPASDINDVYAWKTAAGNLVVAMTVNPLTSPANTSALRLDPSTSYQFKVDTNGDAVADIAWKIAFSGSGPVQDVTFSQAANAQATFANPDGGTEIGKGKTSVGSAITTINLAGGTKAYVGPRDDPFFFDLAGFQAGLKFTGADTFKGTNITAIVIEVPKAAVDAAAPDGKVGVWAVTTKQDTLGYWYQVDRMGRPAIATVFIPKEKKDGFNNSDPTRDAAIYTADVKAALDSLKSPATDALAGLLLPDILTFDLSKPNGYLNGRALADDVIDISLQAITGNATIGDGVNANDNAFSASFPYLAAPNGGGAPGAPNTGTGTLDDGNSFGWTLPAGLIGAGILLAAAGFVQRRKGAARA
ncbi:MAG: DUF4331 family protein [Dehalococcoidia bacterium]